MQTYELKHSAGKKQQQMEKRRSFFAKTIHVLSAGGHCSTCKSHMEATFWIKYIVKDNKGKILTEMQQLSLITSSLCFVFSYFLHDYVARTYVFWEEFFSSLNLWNGHAD